MRRRGVTRYLSLADALAQNVDRSAGPEACWPWTGCTSRPGNYGVFKFKGPRLRAHRVAYELARGPVPDGLFVLHRCDNPPCCNPAHLFLGTNTENTADRNAKGRTARGTRSACHRLTDSAVGEIRQRSAGGESRASLARAFGVDESTIRGVVNGKYWSHVPIAAGGWGVSDALEVLRRVFEATPSSVSRPQHCPEELWKALGYDVEEAWESDCTMERARVEVEVLLRDVNRLLGSSLPLPPYVACEEPDDVEPCERCKAAGAVGES